MPICCRTAEKQQRAARQVEHEPFVLERFWIIAKWLDTAEYYSNIRVCFKCRCHGRIVAGGGLVVVIEKVNQSSGGERDSVVAHGADPATAGFGLGS